MSEIDERRLEAVTAALKKLPIRDFAQEGCDLDNLRLREAARAAILAYEQHRGKQGPVGYEVNFRTFGEGWVGWHRPGPEFTREHYQKKAKTQPDRYLYRDLYASPQPADVGALRTAMAGAFEAGYSQGHIDAHQIKQNRCYSRRDEYLAALATSGGGE